MKKFLFVLMFTSIIVNSQVRINEVRNSLSKPIGFTNNIMGWEFSSFSGKWKGIKNSAGTYICNQLTFRSITVNENKYYILTISDKKGYYKYPSIKEDWKSYNHYRSYVFEEPEFKKFKSFDNPTSNFYEINTLDDYNSNFDLNSLQEYVYSVLKNGKKSDLNFVFQIKKENEKNIRFILPFERGNEFLSESWGFDKCYFEISIIDYNKLITNK